MCAIVSDCCDSPIIPRAWEAVKGLMSKKNASITVNHLSLTDGATGKT
ncbi:hypothetical protein GWN63_03970 [Candidatus Bathyarchaeota archaeon]|nr:hypothetical protein [Candidatus Bathyarchaeota archaeon]NIU81387.1 hypothetical protein [Candidatus Bathyarchaeota archaeon]NIV68013.1 hypothetical protein [Candidatus Bathyarchaeota archaeon]NIW34550.1 hypothetical protein [Candidatus Bathyarchaeota archaeon]